MSGAVGRRTTSAAGAARTPSAAAPRGLKPFADYYPASQRPPKLGAGEAVAGFTEKEARAIHELYWAADDTISFEDFIARCVKHPALKGHVVGRGSALDKDAFAKLFSRLPESFPFPWRSRQLAAASRTFVEALARAPRGTPVKQVHAALAEKDPAFPTVGAFFQAAKDSWKKNPERFPFLAALPKAGGAYVLEAFGAKDPNVYEKTPQGSLQVTAHNARLLRAVLASDEIMYGWGLEELNAFLNEKIGGGVERHTLRMMRERLPAKDSVPSLDDLMKPAGLRLARLIKRLFDGGMRDPNDVRRALHEQHGYPLWTRKVTDNLRAAHPDLVPQFKEAREEARRDEARAFLAEIKERPGVPYADVARAVGMDPAAAMDLIENIRRNDPDALPRDHAHAPKTAYKGAPYTDADKQILRALVDGAGLGDTFHDLVTTLKATHPEFLQRHRYSHPDFLGQALRTQLGITDWRLVQQQRYSKLFADHARRSPAGTEFEDLLRFMQDEYPGAYSRAAAQKLAKRWDAHPELYPEIDALRDEHGKLPWQLSRVRPTKELAERVAKAIRENQGASVPDVVKALQADPQFHAKHPRFNQEHVHILRSAFPNVVPFVDELGHLRGAVAKKAAGERRKDIAQKIVDYAKKHPAVTDRKAAVIARALGVSDRQVLQALRAFPELFPWHEPGRIGTFDLHLATRVAVALEGMQPGTTRQQIVDALREDPRFVERYPLFAHAYNLDAVAGAYPEIVPAFSEAQAQLKMKALVDAVHAAPKGASFREIVKDLRAEHPGVYSYYWEREAFVATLIEGDAKRYPYADALRDRRGHLVLTGRGAAAPTTDESNGQLAARLAKLERIPERLPLLDEIKKLGGPTSFRGFEVLAIQHMLGSQVPLFDTLKDMGVSQERASVVAIPYSTSSPVVDVLRDRGWDVRVPPLDLDVWYEMVHEALVERIAAAEETGRKVLVLDDGGLVQMVLDAHPELKAKAHLLKVVEQTRRGITVVDGSTPENPVVNVAQSWGKYVEGPLIGSSLTVKTMQRLAKIGVQSLKGKHVGVVGYGTIGAPLARFLKEQGAIVTVHDVSEQALKEAQEDGLLVELDPKKFYAGQEITVGATGVRSMPAAALAVLPDGAIIGSGSSKLVEIDVEYLAKNAKKTEVVDAESHPPSVRYTLKDGRRITLLGKGFPMNFDGDIEDIEAEKIQLTRGLMLIGALQATGSWVAGVNALDAEMQLVLLAAFEDAGGTKKGGPTVKKAQRLAELHLAKLQDDRRALAHSRRHS